MQIAVLTFEGFNEIDSFVALGILGRVRKRDWHVSIASPSKRVVSMNGVIARLEGMEAAESALHYVAPVGEKSNYVTRAMTHIRAHLPQTE